MAAGVLTRRFAPRLIMCVGVFSIAFAVSCGMGYRMEGHGAAGSVSLALLVAVISFALLLCAARLLDRFEAFRAARVKEVPSIAIGWKFSLGCFGAIWLCWFFWFALYYPGCTSTDSMDILKMVLGLPFEADHFRYETINSHHPLLYVAFVAIFANVGYTWGGMGASLALCTFAQMTIVAACSTYAAMWTARRTGSKAAGVAVAVFFAINPLIGRYSVTLWKDVPFAAALLVFCLNCFDAIVSEGRFFGRISFKIGFVASALAVFFLRSNGFVVVAIAVVAMVLSCTRARKTVAAWGAGTLVVLLIVQSVASGAFGIVSAHFSESMAIPLQQIGRTVASGGELTEEQAAFIDQVIPLEELKEAYRPDTPNSIKFSPYFNDEFLDGHKLEFLATWISMFPANAGTYVSAWLWETIGFWYAGMSSWLVADAGYEVGSDGEWGGVDPLLPEGVADSGLLSGYAPTSIFARILPFLCRAACLGWLVAAAFALQVGREKTLQAAAISPLLVYWLTFLLAAPISNEFRYLFALHYAFPFIVFCLLAPAFGFRGRANPREGVEGCESPHSAH